MTKDTNDNNYTKTKLALERGQRLKLARNLTHLTRKDMYSCYGVNPNTIQAWEKGAVCLSEKNAQKLIDIFSKEGLNVTIAWLLHGDSSSFISSKLELIGNINEKNTKLKDILTVNGELKFFEELEFFQKNNSNAVTTAVSDEALLPFFRTGDYVGGVLLPKKDLNTLIGQFCIIKLKNDTTVTRKIFQQNSEMNFRIGGINPYIKEPNFLDCEISSAAKITRHWLVGKDLNS